MVEITGWLLDLYDHPAEGVVFWLLGEDGRRLRLHHPFPAGFYAAGPAARLRELWRFIAAQPEPARLARAQGRDLFCPQPLDVLSVEADGPVQQNALFRRAAHEFPELDYYNADIPAPLRHAAAFNTFPLARCRVQAREEDGLVSSLQVLDSPWDLDPPPVPLRVLTLEPDADPARAVPQVLRAQIGPHAFRLPFSPARPLIANLRALLVQHDPDLLLTAWGDTWLLPHLLQLAKETGIDLPLNREPGREVTRREERSYFSYGQIIFRGAQVHLFGRWHIDRRNAMLWDDYDLEGALEVARVTSLPVQPAARLSPGSGISAMQVLTALRGGILVPWHKQQPERLKTALDLLHNDQGGLVYQPLIGLHRDVAEIDFISMYPSVMVRCNISPETRPVGLSEPPPDAPGLIPRTLAPLLEKRVALKRRAAALPAWDPRRKGDKARVSAHKWLLVTCFGYLGYKNARFGRIEAHEAVTAYGREALMRAKEAAEDLGGSVLHLYVDGLWVRQPDARSSPPVPADFQPLLDEIVERTGLPVALDGIYRWVAFLPARRDARIPVANRYFGVFQDGSIKVRGIEARRRDTPPFIASAQMDILRLLAAAPDADGLPALLPQAVALVRSRLADLRAGRVPLEDLLSAQKISRELDRYTTPSPAARAAAQLEALGRHIRPGQRVRLLYLRGSPGVHAWDLPALPDPAALDLDHYRALLVRAAAAVLQPLGLDEQRLAQRLAGGLAQELFPADTSNPGLFA